MKPTLNIYQLATPNIDHYAVYSIASMYEYAKEHGWGLHIQRDKLVPDMHINWTKIALLQHAAKEGKSEYSCLVDADTVVINPDFSMTAWLDLFKNDHAILMTKDTDPFNPNRPNAGLILLDNKAGKIIVDDWMHAARNEGSHLADTHPRNQLVYWNYVQPKFESKQIMVSNAYATKYQFYKPYLHSDKRFIFHFTQTRSKSRTRSMQKIYHKYWGSGGDIEMIKKLLDKHQTGLLTLC